MGLIGVFVLGTTAIAALIAALREYDRTFSLRRFIVTVAVAWIAIAGSAVLLLLGVCAVTVLS
jgi:hypothetical protein